MGGGGEGAEKFTRNALFRKGCHATTTALHAAVFWWTEGTGGRRGTGTTTPTYPENKATP